MSETFALAPKLVSRLVSGQEGFLSQIGGLFAVTDPMINRVIDFFTEARIKSIRILNKGDLSPPCRRSFGKRLRGRLTIRQNPPILYSIFFGRAAPGP